MILSLLDRPGRLLHHDRSVRLYRQRAFEHYRHRSASEPEAEIGSSVHSFDLFFGGAGISASLYYTNRFVGSECQKLPKKVKILADLLTLTNKRVPDESERQLNGR
jgi:hypothetical protein